jgi:hypothetical protein
MALIRDLAQQAMTVGYLTVEAENQLAFMTLQLAAMSGLVKQESRELKKTDAFSGIISEISS